MLGAAFAALSLVPITATPAAADGVIDNQDVDIYADWDNDVDVELDWDVDVSKELSIYGNIRIDGSIQADALSQATLDDKQILDNNDISFEDYQNTCQDDSVLAEPEPGGTDAADEGTPTEATYSNTIDLNASASTATGNVGINLAAGDYNLQENAAVLSSADGQFPAETESATSSFAFAGASAGSKSLDASGSFAYYASSSYGYESVTASGSLTLDLSWNSTFVVTGSSASASSRSARTSGAAEAGSFSLQSLYDNGFNINSTPEDGVSGEQSAELENTDIDNLVDVSDGTLDAADGNIGLNIAAGAFNIQKNALVIASVTGGHLAEATSGVLQISEKNDTTIEDVDNDIILSGSLTSASGNIGVNIAAGVGNLQLNTLTIANALAGVIAPPTTGDGDGTGGTAD
jgi:hypothetical protein